jgi:hypothetical protein
MLEIFYVLKSKYIDNISENKLGKIEGNAK